MDLNTASIPSMAKVVGLDRAYELFLWRPFLSWREVRRVPGLSRPEVEALRRAGAHIKLPGEPLTRREALDARYNGLDHDQRGDHSAAP